MPANLVLRTLEHAWKALESLNAPMAVMGGIALSAWRHVRATQDVDLLVSLGGADTEILLGRLRAAGFRAKRNPPVLALGPLRVVQLLYQPQGAFLELQVDVLLAESEYHLQALTRRVSVHLPAVDANIFVLTCEDLILHKLLAGRMIDRADCVALIKANRASLEPEYLSRWAGHLGVATELSTVLREALASDAGSEA